tara:strand:- start:7 stop:423 length:417 start_codon:yes stop_codon:yes gene_type:complete
MNEEALRLLIQQITGMQNNAPTGGVGNVSNNELARFQEAQRNNYMNEIMGMRTNAPTGGIGNISQAELMRLITSPSQVSSGDPDGMTAPPMQLSPEEIAARQAAYAQQQMMQQQLNGEQMQQRDDSLFDQMVRQRMGR